MDFFTFWPFLLFDKDPEDGDPKDPEEPGDEDSDDDPDDEGPDPGKNEKQFSQADVNRAVKSRLAREKDAHKREKAALQSQIDAAQDELTAYEERMGNLTEARMEGLPEATKALLDKLSPLERLDWLTDNPGAVVETPETPKPKGKGGKPGEEAKINL